MTNQKGLATSVYTKTIMKRTVNKKLLKNQEKKVPQLQLPTVIQEE
jgi:hypothetical protein